MKRMASETRFFSVCWLGKFEDFRSLPRNFSHLEFLALSSWTQVAGTPEHPKNQQIFRAIGVPSEFLPSSFRVPSESRSTRSIPRELHKSHRASHRFLQFFPGQGTFAVLVILLQVVNHYLRRTVPVSLSLVKGCKRHGHMKLGPVLSSSGLNFLEMLDQFILRGAVVLQLAVKKSKKNR